MKLERIVLKGFASHLATDWSPNGAKLLMLVGDQGAGKTTLVSASLRYALYGETPANSVDSLVRTGATDMSVTVVFEHGGARYRVTRGRSTRSGGKSYLELHVADGDAWRPLTADSMRETQAAIEQLLGLDAATFTTSVLLVQGRLNAFAEATAADRKAILGRLLGLEKYELAEARTRELVRDLVARSAARRDQVARLEEGLAARPSLESHLDEAQHELEALTLDEGLVNADLVERRGQVLALAEQIAGAQAAVDEVHRLTAAVDAAANQWRAASQQQRSASDRLARAAATLAQESAVAAAAKRVPALELQQAEARAALEAYQEAVAGADVSRRAREAAERDLAHVERRLADLITQRSDTITCPQCGKTIPAGGAALERRIGDATDAVVGATGELEQLAPVPDVGPKPVADPWTIGEELTRARAMAAAGPSIVEAKQIRDEALADQVGAEKAVADATAAGEAARAALDAARERTAGIEGLRAERSTAEAEVRRLEARASELAQQRRSIDTAVAQAQAGLAQLVDSQEQLDGILRSLAADAAEQSLLERLVVAFSVKGIPARIIESVLPELGRHADELLAELGTGMTLAYRAQRAKKSGDGIIEALDLVVTGRDGERAFETFSGGERTSLALAGTVALARLAARRSGSSLGLLIVDEPDGLSPRGRRAFGQALKARAHAGELEQTIVITHTPDLVDYGDAVYELTWTDAGSVVELVS